MRRLPRRTVLLLGLAATACATNTIEVPTSFEPLDFDYLTKFRLNVASVEINDAWRSGPRDLGSLSPEVPMLALRRMAEQRLLAGGGAGRAVFVIDQASLAIVGGNYLGNFAVHLDMLDEAGARAGFAEARVSRSATAHNDSPGQTRAGLYQLTRALMGDMNVEFDFQIRRSLRSFLQTTAATAPVPPRVETQDLPPP